MSGTARDAPGRLKGRKTGDPAEKAGTGEKMRGNPLLAVVIPANAGIQELPAKAGTSLDPGSSPGGFPSTPSGKSRAERGIIWLAESPKVSLRGGKRRGNLYSRTGEMSTAKNH